jgi:hypothetical protein
MTLDLPSTKLKEDQKWADNIFQLVSKGKQKQAKIDKVQHKKKTPKKPELDSDGERLHDGVVPVTDTRTLADRLHEKLESLKGERGSGKKRKSPEEEDDLKKYISIEHMKTKKSKTDTDQKQNKEQPKDKNDKNDKNKNQKKGDALPNGKEKQGNGKKEKKQNSYFDEDGVEYPADFYSDDEGDASMFDDNELPDKIRNSKKNKNKGKNAPAPPSVVSPEEEENLQFGTFDFSTGKPVPMYLSNKGPKRKNLPRMLAKAEKLQKRLQDESEQGQRKAEQYKWDRMIKKAQGGKVRDNPLLIAKKMANIRKQKKKSAIEWQKRNAQVEKDKDIRLQRRQANIKAKMDRKKMSAIRKTIGASKLKTPSKKHSGGKKSGTRRPGFEGKKGSFINK